jgi:hypothetical protein
MQYYQQLDLQSLIDLLAKETELYTKALSSGKPGEMAQHKERIDALVTEITGRKNAQSMPSKTASV